jgi:hypothetical protein
VETAHAPAAVAVEPPVAFDLGRRRRPIVAIAGAALVVSAFLPMSDHAPRYPIEVPAFALCYACGLAFAVIGATRSALGLRIGVNVLRVVALAIAVAGLIGMLWSRGLGILELLFGLALLVGTGVYQITEQRAAATTAMFGGIAVMAFGMIAGASNGEPGPLVSVAAAICLLFGGMRWVVSTAVAGGTVPVALARFDR